MAEQEVVQINAAPESSATKTAPYFSNDIKSKSAQPTEHCLDSNEMNELPLPQEATKQGLLETQEDDVDLPVPGEEDEYDLPTPPDGGWGWVVVFASFMIHVIADGVAYSFGVFYIEFLEYFEGGRGETGWVGSLVVGVTLSSGPLASALTNKYGCRVVTIAGSFIAALGFIISVFAPSITYLYFSFGILAGLGLGLIYLPAIVSVTYYFEKRRSFATGLAVCGSGIGTFIFAPVSKMLVDAYGWKGACLILAGLLLNCAVCGALFRPLQAPRRKRTKSSVDEEPKDVEMKEIKANGVKITLNGFEVPKDPNTTVKQPLIDNNDIISRSVGNLHIRDNINQIDKSNLRKHNSEIILNDTVIKPSRSKTERRISTSSNASHNHLMYRKDIFYSASLHNIDAYRSNPDLYKKSVNSIPQLTDEENGTASRCKWLSCSKEMVDAFKQMTDFSLLKDPIFLMFAISNLFTSIGFNVPYIYLPDRAKLAGMDKNQGAFLISVIGIANTIGRIIFGWVSDRPVISKYRLFVYNTALTMCGICTILSTLANTYPLMICYAASFGLFIGTYVTLTSVILVDLLGLDRLTSSFGLLLIFQGVATILGPPIAGWVFDGTGSYVVPFYITGTMIGLSGFMLYFIPCLQSFLNKRAKKQRHRDSIELDVNA